MAFRTLASRIFETRGDLAGHKIKMAAERAAAKERQHIKNQAAASFGAELSREEEGRKGRKVVKNSPYSPRTLTALGIKAPKLAEASLEEAEKERTQRFKQLRKEGKLKQHRERLVIAKDESGKLKGNKKFANTTTFKPCSATPEGKEGTVQFRETGDKTPRKGGAMISNKGLRQKIPLNQFVNRNPDNPTGPIRPKCRASIAGVLRSRSFPGTEKTYDKAVRKRVSDLGGVKGKARITAHKLGEREKTNYGPSGAPARHAKYGDLSGKADNKPHTAKKEWGKRYNRPVVKAADSESRVEKIKSKRSSARKEASRKTLAKKSERELARDYSETPPVKSERPDNEGRSLADKFKARIGKSKVTGTGKKKKRVKN